MKMKKNPLEIGLSSAEASRRLKEHGPNVLPTAHPRTFITVALDIIREPMFIFLIIATTLYLFLGELKEGLFLTTFVFLIIAITLYQQGKAEKALKSLRNLTSPRALVIRDGQTIRVNGSEIVPDDVILINEGDRIPADGILLSANDLQIDESLLTGESLPVYKTSSNEEVNEFTVFSGTMVVQGQGVVQVKKTGINTEIGRIGVSLQALEVEKSPLQIQTAQLVKIFAVLSIFVSLLLVIILGTKNGDWLKASLSGIAVAMSLIPEEFPVILTLFPILGAWRLSKHKVLTRRISAIETLGATSVLCVDKTGTMTENKMTVTKIWANDQYYDVNYTSEDELPENFHSLIEFAILASEIEPFDPMEKAFHQLGNHFLAQTEHLHPSWELVHEYDVSSDIRAKTHVWTTNEGHHIVAIKGAPETIIDLCQVNNDEKLKIELAIKLMADEGLRVLGVAKAFFKGESWPKSQRGFNFCFLGAVGLRDPLREGITEAVQQCKDAGIRIIMITGDYAPTAKAIASQAGLLSEKSIIGTELDSLSDLELQDQMKSITVCARITPNQKLRIVQSLKKEGSIVAMTGDGVNDAPALKAAHVGIAMGTRGTDVAREASGLVLVDDNFTSIVGAIRIGRNIFDNIKKSMSYILAIHVPIAGMALLPVIFGLPPFFYPMHIAFLQLIIDPACSIAFENEPPEPNIMSRKPRNPAIPLINRKNLIFSLLQGLGILAICLMAYTISLQQMVEPQARAFTFVTLVISNIILIFSNRTEKNAILELGLVSNKILVWIILFTLVFLFSTIYVPFLAALFQFTALSTLNLLLSIVVGLCSIFWFEILRLQR